ncbi:MAG: c-type cytochrome [Phycisphaerales bacterium]|nr:MAG: c-type cytochrome [Phycisphaerales bacterium]
MKRIAAMTRVLTLIVLCGVAFAGQVAPVSGDYLSPLEIVADSAGRHLYITEATAKQVVVFDVEAGKVSKTISLPGEPTGLVLTPDDSKLYVTCAGPGGRVAVVNVRTGKVTKRLTAGHTPCAPALSPDAKTLYVCNQFNNNISALDLASGKRLATVAVHREPIAAAITADGDLLFVANHVPAGASDADYTAAEISVIDTAANEIVTSIRLPNGSTALRDITISPDGKHAYVTHILARYQLPTTQLERGWMNTNALTIIDVPNKKYLNTVLLDDIDLGAANPWSVACTPDGKYICVTTAGTHELSVIDRSKLHDRLARVAAGEKVSGATTSVEDVPNDLAFLVEVKRRLKLTGNGPRGLAVIGTKAYVAEYFTDSLGIVDVHLDVRPKAESVALGPKEPVTTARKGERLFHDATICFQMWQSCSSCHPGAARVDGLNWDLLNDGLGNPKNTKSLLLAHKTPPAMVMGARADAETAVRSGIRHIQFAVRPEEDAAAIDEYLKKLRPVPSPYLVKGKLSARARRGGKLFESAGCASCHTPGLYTDMKKHDLGTAKGLDKGKAFDTPTLIEVWRTAPYLYDGRAKTMVDVLKKHNPADKHGRTSEMTDRQIKDLVEFVLSL